MLKSTIAAFAAVLPATGVGSREKRAASLKPQQPTEGERCKGFYSSEHLTLIKRLHEVGDRPNLDLAEAIGPRAAVHPDQAIDLDAG